jgi:hypothetical protein
VSAASLSGRAGLSWAEARDLRDQAPCDRRCEEHLARCDDAHRLEQRLRGHVLQQETARAGLERVVDVLVDVEGGQDEDARHVELSGADQPRRLDAVHHGHAHVSPRIA